MERREPMGYCCTAVEIPPNNIEHEDSRLPWELSSQCPQEHHQGALLYMRRRAGFIQLHCRARGWWCTIII